MNKLPSATIVSFAAGLLSCVFAAERPSQERSGAAPTASVVEFPGVPWNEMRATVSSGGARITAADGRCLFAISPSPRTASLDGLVLKTEGGRLEIDARVPMARGLKRLVIRGYPARCDSLFGKPCTHLAEWSGANGAELNLYLEGRDTDIDSYYYEERPCRLTGRRRVLSQLASPPAATKGFAFRYDIMKFGDGRFAYYGTRAAPLDELKPSRDPLPKHPPELVFHAAFDGSAEATSARGNPRPVKASGLSYAPGRKGRAVRMNAKSASVLAYETEGNFDLRQGTVALWVKLEWPEGRQSEWRSMVGFPRSGETSGNGQTWLWWWGRCLRFDAADDARHAQWVQPRIDGEWRHVVATWDDERFRVWLDGECALDSAASNRSTTTSPMAAALRHGTFDFFTYDRLPADVFYVGCQQNGRQIDGLIDELKVWNAPMPENEVLALCEREGCRPSEGGDKLSAPRARAPDYAALFANDGANPYARDGDEKLDLELVETIRLDEATVAKLTADKRFRAVGKPSYRQLGGTAYLECGARKDDRFALRFAVDPKFPLYCIDIDYPDDAKRTADILVQGVQTTQWDGTTGADYALQVGYACGDEYPSSGKIATHRCLYWTYDSDVAMIVTTARAGVPAAVAEVRVYRVKDARLPSLKVNEPPSRGGWHRTFGLYYEDLAIGYDFATRRTSGRDLDELSTMIDRTAAYMKYCGQNLLCYPGVWYDGLVGERYYNPRNHAERYLDAWYVKFAKEGLYVVPTINPDNMAIPPGIVTRKTMDDGSLNASPIAILSTGRPNWGGRCNTPPNFCFGHPDVQREIERQIDVLLDQGAPYPSFKGLCMHLTMHNMLWWGDISSGYNDYVIDAFERDTGIRVPRATTAVRARAHAAWLRENARDAWVQWRCDQVTRFYARMAAKLRTRRPDLKLWLNSFVQPDFTRPGFVNDDFMERQAREAGLDKKALAAIPNLVACQTALPAFCRKRDRNLFPDDASYAYNRVLQLKKGYFALLDGARFPWINQHDLYWENPVGREDGSLSCDWLKECPWHVTTINPGGVHALRDFVAPLRHRDVLGMSKGGFLVGTYGMEEHLRKFAAAYRALPAVVMDEIGRQGNVVLRHADFAGKSYFYLVNTDHAPAEIALSVPAGTRNLVTGANLAGDVRLSLGPYQLMSFAAPSGRPAGLSASRP